MTKGCGDQQWVTKARDKGGNAETEGGKRRRWHWWQQMAVEVWQRALSSTAPAEVDVDVGGGGQGQQAAALTAAAEIDNSSGN